MADISSPATLYRWADIEPEPLSPTLTRQFLSGEQAMLARIVLKKGTRVPEHAHPNEQIAFILSGSLRFSFPDGSTKTANSGEVLVIPANLPHAAEALEDTVDFDIFTPPRQDWIDGNDAYLRGAAVE